MRALLVLAVGLSLGLTTAGCLEDEPVPPPAPEPDAACEARGLVGGSCSAFCELHSAACGLPEPPAVPYPAWPPSAPPAVPSAPVVPSLPVTPALPPAGGALLA